VKTLFALESHDGQAGHFAGDFQASGTRDLVQQFSTGAHQTDAQGDLADGVG
jgi:hypothetical protein